MFKILKNLHKTFYSSVFYSDLVHSWTGAGIGFLFIIALVSSINATGTLVSSSKLLFNEEYDALFEALPPLKIYNGAIEIEGESIQTLSLQEIPPSPKLIITFDMTEKAVDAAAISQRMQTENIFILVTKNTISVRDLATDSIDIEKADKINDVVISREEWIQLGQALKLFFVPLGAISAFGLFVCFSVILGAVGGITVFIISPLFKLNVPFTASMRLSAAAGVPVAVFFSFMQPQPILIILLWLGFVFFALFSAKNGQTQQAAPRPSPH